MTDQTTTITDVDAQAIVAGGDAIEAFLKRQYPDLARLIFRTTCEELAELALRAGSEVYAAAEQADADRLLAETGLAGIDIDDGAARVKLVLAHEMAVRMATAFDAILDAHPSAANYVEQEFFPRGTRDPYIFVVCKPGGKTPHQLRREAEAERDRLRTALTELAKDFRQGSRVVSREVAAQMIETIVTEGAAS